MKVEEETNYTQRITRYSGQIRDLTAIAKNIILKEHALNKTDAHEFWTESKIDECINYYITSQNRQDAKGILKRILKKYNEINS